MKNETTTSFEPVQTQRVSEIIYNQIYQQVADGRLKPGERLPAERELVNVFGCSRPSIREALRMLEQDGLIETTSGNSGSLVCGITLKTVEKPLKKLIEAKAINLKELIDYRIFNDSAYAKWAALYRQEEDIAVLEEILDKAAQCIDNTEAFIELDRAFHSALAHASYNSFAVLINGIVESISFSFLLQEIDRRNVDQQYRMCEEIYKTHYAIFEAVKAQDPEAAQASAIDVVDMFQMIIDEIV